jgi:acyl-CoA synthetase (AMP-forming)/AMP-acid ligase II
VTSDAGIGARAKQHPDATAIVAHPRRVTFAELDERQRRLVGALRKAKVRKKDRVAVFASNRPESLEAMVGMLRAGIVPVPINPLLTEPEVAYVLEDSGARWLLTDRPIDAPHVEHIVTFGDAYERLLQETKPARIGDFTLGRAMHYTSGTTGSPKGVWVPPSDQKQALLLSRRFRSLWAMTDEDVHLVCSPLAHSAPLRYSLRTLEAGGMVVLPPRFDPEEILATIALFGVTSTFMVPTHLERILALGRTVLMRYDLSSMRLMAHAGAPIREETKREVLALFPEESVWEFYGSTEGQATRVSAEHWLDRPGTVGRPLRGVSIEVLDEQGNPRPPGEVGEIWVQPPAEERFTYWGDKKKTAGAWSGDSFTVGDLGYLDPDGYLFLTGRKHDTIITGGVNVYPQEVEQTLMQHPAVREVLVYGAPHEEWGQQVEAAIVPQGEMPVEPEHLKSWARERLAGFKLPRRIVIVDELPKTATGKLKRQPLVPAERRDVRRSR